MQFAKKIMEHILRNRYDIANNSEKKKIFSDVKQARAFKLLIAFFSLMFVFTIVSRISTSITIPKVSVSTKSSGTLNPKYTLTGTIQAKETEDILLPSGIIISSVYVKEGQHVNEGDVLLKLDEQSLSNAKSQLENEIKILDLQISNSSNIVLNEDTTSLERVSDSIKNANEDYENILKQQEIDKKRADEDKILLQSNYESALKNVQDANIKAKNALIEQANQNIETANAELNDAKYAREESLINAKLSIQSAEQAVSSAESVYDAAVSSVSQAKNSLYDAEKQLNIAQNVGDETAIASAEAMVTNAQNAVSSAQSQEDSAYVSVTNAKENLTSAKNNYTMIEKRQNQLVENAEQKLYKANQKLVEVQSKTDFSDESIVIEANSNLNEAKTQLDAKIRENEDMNLTHQQQLLEAERNKTSANFDVLQAENQLQSQKNANENDKRQKIIEKLTYQNERTLKQNILDLFNSASDGTIKANSTGIIKSIAQVSTATQENVPVVTITCDTKGLIFSAKTDISTAKNLQVGTKGNLIVNNQSTTATITSIGIPDEENQVEIVASLETSDFSAGSLATVEISTESERFQSIVPLSAIRSENGKNVIFIIRETETITGVEQKITAIEVNIKETTPEKAAIDGAISNDDIIITYSSKPISEGDTVRVQD